MNHDSPIFSPKYFNLAWISIILLPKKHGDNLAAPPPFPRRTGASPAGWGQHWGHGRMADDFYEFSIIFPFVNPKIWGNLLGKVFMFLMPPLKPWWHRGDLLWDIASFAWLKIRKKLVCWLFFVLQRDSITFSWHFTHFKSRWAHGLLTHTHTTGMFKFSERCDIDAADSCDFKPLGRLSKRWHSHDVGMLDMLGWGC